MKGIKQGYNIYYILFIFLASFSLNLGQHEKQLMLSELSSSSQIIVKALTTNIYTYYSMDKKHVYTEIELQIEESYKGDLLKWEKIKMITFGGQIDGLTHYALGLPSFALNQKSIYFLSEDRYKQSGEIRNYFVTGAEQGKFDIFNDEITKKEVVKRNNSSLPMKMDETGQFVNSSIEEENEIDLAIFLQNIKNTFN